MFSSGAGNKGSGPRFMGGGTSGADSDGSSMNAVGADAAGTRWRSPPGVQESSSELFV